MPERRSPPLKDIDLAEIVRRLEAASRGGGGFEATAYEDALLAISHSNLPTQDVPPSDRQPVVATAIRNLFQSANRTPAGFKNELAKAAKAWLATPTTSYIVVGSILGPPGLPQWNTTVDRVRISTMLNLPRRFDRAFVAARRQPRLVVDDSRLPKCLLRVKARSPLSALYASLDALDYLRGVMNFALNRGLYSELTSDPARPMNRVLAGPFFTIHKSRGAPAVETLQYDPFFFHYTHISRPRSGWPHVVSEARTIRNICGRSPMSASIRTAFLRYCRALDPPDAGTAFMKLWGVLEFLTSTTGGRYDDTIKRTAFLYADPFHERHSLEVLRYHRNSAIHAGADGPERELLTTLHRHVANLLTFVLQGAYFFSSLDEIGEFLGLPPDKVNLERKFRLAKRARVFKRLVAPRARRPRADHGGAATS